MPRWQNLIHIGTDKRAARALCRPFHYDSAALKKPGGTEEKIIGKKKFSKWNLFTARYKHHVILPVIVLNSPSSLVQHLVEATLNFFGTWNLELLRTLDLGPWTLDFGLWTLDFVDITPRITKTMHPYG